MKKLLVAALFCIGFASVSFAQVKTENDSLKQKKHSMTECMDGKHNCKHGEKGHKCNKECSEQHMKKHVCTAECKNGKHVYKHGEKGHVCGAECKKHKSEM